MISKYTTNIRKVGGSIMLADPPAFSTWCICAQEPTWALQSRTGGWS